MLLLFCVLLFFLIRNRGSRIDGAFCGVTSRAVLCCLKITGFSKDMGSSLSLLPSLMSRLENLLVAIELKDVMLSSFPEASQISASSVSHMINLLLMMNLKV
jgi:hypothetical protein